MMLALTSLLFSSLLILATVPECQAQSLLPTVRAKQPAPLASALAEAPPLTFRLEGGRLLAMIDRDLLETDFVLRTPAAAVAPAPTGVGSAAAPGMALASGALRLQRAGDSLVLLEYTGTVHGQLQYRRRDVMPILRMPRTRGLVVDATPLWAAVGSQAADAMALWQADMSGAPEATPAIVETTAGGQPRDPHVVGTQLDILRLPKQPMQPRLYDPRIRFMNARKHIYRWRLEKQDLAAPVSDVVQPIVFRLLESVPPAWVPHIKRSIEKWNPAFEAIGFRNAIVVHLATDPPVPGREVVVHWDTTSRGELGATASPTVDSRTGELLGGRITLNVHNIPALDRNVLLRGELDPRTPLPLPDSLAPILLDRNIVHEVGHALGLDHNFRGSGVYPTDSLRRLSFVRRMGWSASVMSYGDGNYVAQPEDGMTFLDRRIEVGPYDRWALDWGYRPIPGATTAEEETPILEQWRSAQDTTPALQGSLGVRLDPLDQPATAGDDPVKSSGYALRSLTRLAKALDPKRDTVVETHPRPFHIARMWSFRLQQAANVVGGVTPQTPYPADLAKLQLLPIDSARQVHAMQFVLAHAFYGQDELVVERVLDIAPPRRPPPLVLFDSVAYGWYQEQWQGSQKELLLHLVGRLATLSDQVGLRTALCQEVAVLEERLSAAASPVGSSEHAKKLHAIVAAAFAPGRACR